MALDANQIGTVIAGSTNETVNGIALGSDDVLSIGNASTFISNSATGPNVNNGAMAHETRLLVSLAPPLTQTAALFKAVGHVALCGISNALALIGQPAIALDRCGFVLDVNAVAQQIFDDEFFVRNRRLKVRDKQASSALESLADKMRIARDRAPLLARPIVVRRMERQPLVIRVLPVAGPARTPILGASALLVISDLNRRAQPQPSVLAETFGLTRAETRLASIMAAGISIERAAGQLGLSRETVRNQLKAVFAKTTTNRQSELVALLSRL